MWGLISAGKSPILFFFSLTAWIAVCRLRENKEEIILYYQNAMDAIQLKMPKIPRDGVLRQWVLGAAWEVTGIPVEQRGRRGQSKEGR